MGKVTTDEAGTTTEEVGEVEEGKKNITLRTLLRLCKILGIKRIDIS